MFEGAKNGNNDVAAPASESEASTSDLKVGWMVLEPVMVVRRGLHGR